MNRTNESGNEQKGLKEKILRKVGIRLMDMAINPQSCAGIWTYEPELPSELTKEMTDTE